MGPIGTDIGDLRLDRLRTTFLMCTLGLGEGIFMVTGQILAVVPRTVRAGYLGRQPQVNADLSLPNGLGRIGDLTLKVHIPVPTSIFRETACFEGDIRPRIAVLGRTRVKEAKPDTTVRNCTILDTDIGGLKRGMRLRRDS